MDNYRSSDEKPEEQITTWSISTENQWPSSPVKSYTCSFCSKGFSSAQALGGHMNIHRKDRAKLRDENILSLDLAKSQDPPDDHLILQVSEDKSRFPFESTSSLSRKEDAIASSITDSRNSSPHIDDEGSELKPSSIQKELDLELRLGPDPNDRQTREFF